MNQQHDGDPGNRVQGGRGQRKSLAWLGSLGLLCATSQCLAQETLQITFDGPPLQPPGSAYTVQQYIELNMWFRPLPGSDGFGRVWSSPVPGRPDNGTPYLQAAFGDSLRFSFLDSSTFNLVSVDLAEYSTVVPNAVTVQFIGYRFDGSIVNTSFTTDGIIDGTGPGVDFQTFHFGPEFSNLSRVEIPTFGWSLDNLVVVPEPGTWALFILGAVVATVLFRKGRRGNISMS